MRKLGLALSIALICGLRLHAQTANAGYPEIQLAANYVASDTGSANVMVGTINSCPAALVPGALYRVKPANANTTTTPTYNFCGLGAKTITKFGTSALAANDLITTAVAVMTYDGSGFELINPMTVPVGTVTSIATTGPITGGTITNSGTIACATCVTSAASLTSGNLMTGAGSQGAQTNANIVASVGGIFTTYDGLTTAGLGHATVLGVSDVTAQTASQTTVNLIASTGAAGHYLVRLYVNQNALCTTGTGLVFATVSWTDASHAHSAQTIPLTLANTAVSTPNGYIDAVVPLWSATASAISYTTTYTACTSGTASYDLHAEVERTN